MAFVFYKSTDRVIWIDDRLGLGMGRSPTSTHHSSPRIPQDLWGLPLI
ncbi:MAG: hypothetical protein AAGD25_13000 [Cyanobacteria bacterium P01_F01_bin.150]